MLWQRKKKSQSPGWDAIDLALRRIYGETEPKHFAAALPMTFDILYGELKKVVRTVG